AAQLHGSAIVEAIEASSAFVVAGVFEELIGQRVAERNAVANVRVVQSVKEFRAELNFHPLGHVRSLEDPDVQLVKRWSSLAVARYVPKRVSEELSCSRTVEDEAHIVGRYRYKIALVEAVQ